MGFNIPKTYNIINCGIGKLRYKFHSFIKKSNEMNQKSSVPAFIKILGWFISLFAYSLGFWHTHLGLREFRALSSSNGSIIISAIILLLLIVAYYRAIGGMKVALIFYALCAFFFFTFNINSFYPTYLGRKLLKEEAIAINDTLQNFTSRINRDYGKEDINKKYNSVCDLRDLLKQEISKQSGFGDRSKDYLQQINNIIGEPYIKPNINVGHSPEEWSFIANEYNDLINKRLKSYVAENLGVGKVDIIDRINEVNKTYTPQLEKIIEDNSRINIDSIRSNPQINTMQQVVTRMDNICSDANKISAQNEKTAKVKVCNKYGEVRTQNLGAFAHTIGSVRERIDKVDTWGIIILCLFIDFIVPLAIYFLIRRNENEDESESKQNSLFKKFRKPGPVHMND